MLIHYSYHLNIHTSVWLGYLEILKTLVDNLNLLCTVTLQ